MLCAGNIYSNTAGAGNVLLSVGGSHVVLLILTITCITSSINNYYVQLDMYSNIHKILESTTVSMRLGSVRFGVLLCRRKVCSRVKVSSRHSQIESPLGK